MGFGRDFAGLPQTVEDSEMSPDLREFSVVSQLLHRGLQSFLSS